MDKLPRLSVDLIDKLDREFPERSPKPTMSRDKSMFEAGKREVVRYLLKLKEVTAEEEMESGDVNV